MQMKANTVRTALSQMPTT